MRLQGDGCSVEMSLQKHKREPYPVHILVKALVDEQIRSPINAFVILNVKKQKIRDQILWIIRRFLHKETSR